MFHALKRSIYDTPPRRPLRWLFFGVGGLFVLEGLLVPFPGHVMRLGISLVGIVQLTIFVAESFPITKQHAVGMGRLIGVTLAFAAAVLLIVNAVIMWQNPLKPW